jgi:hypothetical protein
VQAANRPSRLVLYGLPAIPVVAFVAYALFRFQLPDTDGFHLLATLPLLVLGMTWFFLIAVPSIRKVWLLLPPVFLIGIVLIEMQMLPESLRDVPRQVLGGALFIAITFVIFCGGDLRDRRKRNRQSSGTEEPE